MRNVPEIWEAWRSGDQVGDRRPCTRVTVQRGWNLQTTDPIVGLWTRGPARWFQDENSALQIETEVPNVSSVNLSRGSDGDAGTCDITIINTEPTQYGTREATAGRFGTPGYYTWDHGRAQDARARWRQTPNPWNDVLVPNALIRTYQGFGGHDKALADAITDGNIVLNGVWLVDDISVSTDGTIGVKCRDMAKLLIDQQLFPPLVPLPLYPLRYRRWIVRDEKIPAEPVQSQSDYCNASHYLTSSTDETYGQFNTGITGHPGSDAFDISGETGPLEPGAFAHQATYWMSEPKDSPDDSVWLEFGLNDGTSLEVNEIYCHPWEGNIGFYDWGASLYHTMVSVWENGAWAAPEVAGGGVTPQGIPYVTTFTAATSAPTAELRKPPLPRTYRATRIRLTFTRLVPTQEGGYRAGIRKVMACFRSGPQDARIGRLVFAGASMPVNPDHRLGYWQVRGNGQVYAFGDARVYPVSSPNTGPRGLALGMAAHPSGSGYWYVDNTGVVVSAGDADWYGDLAGADLQDVVDVAPTPTGDGYWLLRNDGHIYSYGDAADQGVGTHTATMPTGAPALARSLESHPDSQGYWILYTDGVVEAFGAAAHHGDANRSGFTVAEYVASIRRTSTGDGYWITSGNGIIQAFGDAQHRGNAPPPGKDYTGGNWYKGLCWDLIPSPIGDAGYAIQRADGHLMRFGDSTGLEYGSVGAGYYTIREDGNYKDYSDIVRELLLWSGYLLHKTPQPGAEQPDIFGNIESTGAYAEADLPVAMFDKKPGIEAIKELRDIVGYIFFVDAEGGARFESPNWWTIGNFLTGPSGEGRVPLNYLPEVDEAVNLLSHAITFSAASARSELIIATENPMPTEFGPASQSITQTRITPKTAPDLRGLVSPAMWTNGKFLNPYEQRVMADLIDMRMWFARRTAQISCVANPLIDVNDQIRVIESQTGEVFVHYVKSIDFSHDLESGEYTMNLTTHWLGGTPYGRFDFFIAGDVMPSGDGYWQCTISGLVYAFGAAETYDNHQADSHTGWVTGFRSTPSGAGYYTVDQHGKVLTYGDAVWQGNAQPRTVANTIPGSVPINDMALTPSGAGYWLLEQDGTIHAFGDAVFYGQTDNGGRKIPTGSPAFAVSIESHPITQGYWVLWSDGVVDNFNLPHHGNASLAGNKPDEYAAVLRATPDGGGYWIASGGSDNLYTGGNATDLGGGGQYPDDAWTMGLIWEILVHPAGGYALARADGNLLAHDFEIRGQADVAPVEAFWALVPEGAPADDLAFPVSAQVQAFLAGTGSPSATNAVASGFAAPSEDVVRGTAQ